MMKFTSPILRGLIPAFVAASFLTSCSEPEKTETWKEAAALHEQMVELGEQLHSDLASTMVVVNDKFEAFISNGDSAMARELASVSSRLDRFDGNFHAWSETVVAMPGSACSHDHDDHDDHAGHDHDDHAGHDHDDHAGHDHVETLPDGLSDEDMLEIQQEIMKAFDVLKRNFDSILAISEPGSPE